MSIKEFRAIDVHTAYLRQLAIDEKWTADERAKLGHLLRAGLATARERVEQ